MNDFSSLQPYLRQLPAAKISDRLNLLLHSEQRVVVTAPPGAGKSTLLPLTMLQQLPSEGKIVMLEPRRIAARQIATRMASMLGEPVGKTVGYRVRFETKVSRDTRIEVVTEGILTRMLVEDATLDGIDIVVFDEFHERSLASDTALALTREVQQLLRPELRLVVMSATIDASTLCAALQAPLVESEGRMFDVEIRYGEEADERNCAEVAARTVVQAHREHEGDILVFLPGQGEIIRCCELIGDALGATSLCPLYGMLPPEEQSRAIAPSPPGQRKVVVATPVAETSLTIEGVRVVVDSGFCRTLVYQPRNSMSRLETVRISMDMARQRSGRAGRVAEGICYRLWTKATELRMEQCRKPEILDADLAPVALDIAAWDGARMTSLPWLTPPPAAHLSQAESLLRALGAIDSHGAITTHGRRLQQLPCHPRIAQMLVLAENAEQQALAADVAAILEEKDPMPSDTDADLNSRIVALREARGKHSKGRWQRLADIARQYRQMVGCRREDAAMPDSHLTGWLIAGAYPERIAMADGHGRYRLASGGYVQIDDRDELSACNCLAVAEMGSRIFLASPVDEGDLKRLATRYERIEWDSRQGRVVAQQEWRIGSLVLQSQPIAGDPDLQEQRTRVICEAAPKEGLSMFDFNADEVQRLQQRVAAVAHWHEELGLPDLSAASVLARAEEWLPFYIGKASTTAELKRIRLDEALWSLLSYTQQQAVERLAPTHIQVPTGSRIRVDYRPGAEAPVVSVRLQECFGMTDTPRVDDGRRPVLMELLSPGFKPVQLTQDLRSFWQTTYFDVRKELRRRYPKHHWPDNPLEAEAVRGVKRRSSDQPSPSR